MITFINRKDLLKSSDLRRVNYIREILLANRIDYYVKAAYPRTSFAMSESRARTASFGPTRQQEQYTVYVRKTDWEHAMYLLRNNDC